MVALASLLALLSLGRAAVAFLQPQHSRLATPATAAASPLFRKAAVSESVDAAPSSSSATDAPGPQLGAWMPLGSASSLTGLTPVQIRVCGLDIAVWHKPLPKDAKKGAAASEWSAMVDACPHRLAPLSQGRVDPESGCIECPYHGWAFDTDGTLKALPQLDEGRTIDVGSAATALPVHAAGDLLFVFLPSDITEESWPITYLPEDHYPYLKDRMERGTTYYSRDLPYSVDFLLENFIDPAHIPFAHHSLQGTRDDARPIEMRELANNFTHVECSFKDVSGGVERDGVLSFQRPAFYHFRIRANETTPYEPRLLIFTVPIEEGKCRAIMPDFSFKFVPKWLGHLGSNRFLNSDTWLHDTERAARMHADSINKRGGSVAVGAARAGRKPTEGLNYVLASKSDLGPSSFRKWWSKHGFADAPPNTFGPASATSLPVQALSRAEQIDPWENHAYHCTSCRTALKRMRQLQKASVAGAAIGALLLRRKLPLAITAVLAGMWAYNFLRKFATTIEGNTNRAEIAGRSVAAIK
ncbi:hypothetical protein ACHAXT_007559 [Thalassiosira profunda]